MKGFESGISDFEHHTLTLDITFPIDNKGQVHRVCEYCKLFTGRRCAVTEEVILRPEYFVGYRCPLNNNKE